MSLPAVDWHQLLDFVPYFCLHFLVLKLLLNSQLAVSPCYYICFSSLASFCFDTDHWLDFITSSQTQFLALLTLLSRFQTSYCNSYNQVFFISSNWLICCRWRKVIFFDQAFFCQLFSDRLSTLFCHVFLVLHVRKKKKFFYHFTTNTTMFYPLECQFYICSDF